MKSVVIDDETAHRLRIFIASNNSGKVHGKIGPKVSVAINQYIDREEKIAEELAKSIFRE